MVIECFLCARHWAKHFTSHCILTIPLGCMWIIVPTIKMKKLRFKGITLAQGHTASKRWIQNLNPGLLGSKSFLTIKLPLLLAIGALCYWLSYETSSTPRAWYLKCIFEKLLIVKWKGTEFGVLCWEAWIQCPLDHCLWDSGPGPQYLWVFVASS